MFGRRKRFALSLVVALIAAVAVAVAVSAGWLGMAPQTAVMAVSLDREQVDSLTGSGLLNPSTQSVNRYHSTLRGLGEIECRLKERQGRLDCVLRKDSNGEGVNLQNIDVAFVTPLLPYSRSRELDEFDAANLMLAEFARNGIALSFQEKNQRFGSFHASEEIFAGGEEYFFEDGALVPNPGVRPIRMSVTNNCLAPGLWEVAAMDSVGEMYHGWFEVPREFYLSLVRAANELSVADDVLAAALEYREDLSGVEVQLDRLREAGELLVETEAQVALDKEVGGYSSQDSRRKVQKGYFELLRGDERLEAASFAELAGGDVFSLRAFVPPGVYSAVAREQIPYDSQWKRVEIREVTPRTRYPGGKSLHAELGHVELIVHSGDGSRAVIAGNLPVSLLVAQEDYQVPAFGAGVLLPSEAIERRYLRLREGPAPHYAYLVQRTESGWGLLNNHEFGLEQLFFRTFEREGRLFLRVTFVAYERIVDLLELEVEIEGELAERLRRSTSAYRPPLFRVYEDSNIL